VQSGRVGKLRVAGCFFVVMLVDWGHLRPWAARSADRQGISTRPGSIFRKTSYGLLAYPKRLARLVDRFFSGPRLEAASSSRGLESEGRKRHTNVKQA
jgi:hypothetical protein